jgi:hypothetical protein
MLLDNQTTTIVIVVGVILLAIVVVLVGKNVDFSMFGVTLGTKDKDRGPAKTVVGKQIVVGEKGRVDEILGTEGAAADGDVDVASGARVDGVVNAIVGRRVGVKSKDDKDA